MWELIVICVKEYANDMPYIVENTFIDNQQNYDYVKTIKEAIDKDKVIMYCY